MDLRGWGRYFLGWKTLYPFQKRGNIRKILEVFYANGALPEILIDAHPHIGTNMLPGIKPTFEIK